MSGSCTAYLTAFKAMQKVSWQLVTLDNQIQMYQSLLLLTKGDLSDLDFFFWWQDQMEEEEMDTLIINHGDIIK